MITNLVGLATVLLPMLYMVLWGSYLWFFFEERSLARRWGRSLVGAVIVVHVGLVILRGQELGRFPLGTPLELASLLALSLTTIYIAIERVLKVRQTGVLILGLAFVLQFLASAFAEPSPTVSPLLNDPGYAIHAVLVLMAYTALSMGFLYALLYGLLTRQLEQRSFGLMFRRLPPLETLERLSVSSVKIGVPLLFLALCGGHLWMYSLMDRLPPEQVASLSPFDPKVLTSWVILIVYSVGLIGHEHWGWRGRRMNRLAVIAWIVVVVALGVIHHAFPPFHDFNLRDGA